MAGESKFFSRNYIDANALVTTDNAGSAATVGRILDRDVALKYQTSGLNNDALPVTLEARFQIGGVALTRTFDTVAVLGHNLKGFILKYWDGAAYVALPGGTIVGEIKNYTIITFAPVQSQRFQCVATTTQLANQEKQVGEILVLSTTLALGTDIGPSRMGFAPIQTAIVTPMADAGKIVNQLRWAGNRVERFKVRLGYTLLTQADYDNLRALIRTGIFTCWVEPVERPSEFYEVTGVVAGAPSDYSSVYKGNGYNLDIELEEV